MNEQADTPAAPVPPQPALSGAGANPRISAGHVRNVLAGAALAFVGLWLTVALVRAGAPVELEWNEGSQVAHVARVLRGEPIYVEPSLAFVPQLYTPLFYWTGAVPSAILGPGFAPLRLVSILATLGSLALVFAIVRRESRDTACAFVAAGLFAASYKAGGAWFDVARSDALMVCFLLACVWALRAPRLPAAGVLAGLALAAAFFTKQTALVIGAALAVGAWARAPRHRRAFLATAAGAIALGCFVLDAVSGGWFWYYVFGIAGGHDVEPKAWIEFWTRDVARVLPAALLAGAFVVSRAYAGSQGGGRGFFLAALAGALASAWLGRLHVGGYANVLMPLHAFLAVAAGLGLAALLRERTGPLGRAQWTAAALCAAQFLLFAYDPLELLPPKSARADERALAERLEAIDGPVFAPYSGWLAESLGRPPHAHFMAMADVRRADPGRGAALDAELREALFQKRFRALLLAYDHFPAMTEAAYREVEPPYADAEPEWIRSGPRSRPTRFLVPR